MFFNKITQLNEINIKCMSRVMARYGGYIVYAALFPCLQSPIKPQCVAKKTRTKKHKQNIETAVAELTFTLFQPLFYPQPRDPYMLHSFFISF